MTVIPAAANFGAHSREVLPPAEKMATAGFAAIASVALTILYFFPLYSTSLPIDLSEATGINSVMGKFLSANTSNILVPTRPVAPTTATFTCFCFFVIKKKAFPVREGSHYLVIQNNQTPSRCGNCFLVCFVCFIIICITDSKIGTNIRKSKFFSFGRSYPNSISKLTRSTNCRILSLMSAFVISFKRVGPNFSTQKEAIAEPTMMAVFMFSKDTSFVCAI